MIYAPENVQKLGAAFREEWYAAVELSGHPDADNGDCKVHMPVLRSSSGPPTPRALA